MVRYVDGFVITIPKKNLDAYKKMAKEAGKVWMKHGAVGYYECIGDDLDSVKEMGGLPFPVMTQKKPNEVVVFSFIIYKSKSQRDKINKKIMQDPAMNEMCPDGKKMPFEMKKMAYGGFEAFVQLEDK